MTKKNSAINTYAAIVKEISANIRRSRYVAAQCVNRELLLLYYSTGGILSKRVKTADWGEHVLDTISSGVQNTFPGIRGFSTRNLKNMRRFFEVYSGFSFGKLSTGQIEDTLIGQSATAQLPQPALGQSTTALIDSKLSSQLENVFLQISFTHHILLLQKCPELEQRIFYMQQSVHNQWSVEVLRYHISSNLYRKKGKISSNFTLTLPENLKKHALEAFKDEYLLNFITVNEGDGEEVLENELVRNLRDFLMSLGREFAFMGNQYRMVVDDDEFFVDLLFYHRRLQSLIAIELKTGKFKPEYAGKMNFYLEALDQLVKIEHENPSIGIILCREKKNTIVEFAFKRINRPMGVATYVLADKLPPKYRKYLPTPAQLKKAALKGKNI